MVSPVGLGMRRHHEGPPSVSVAVFSAIRCLIAHRARLTRAELGEAFSHHLSASTLNAVVNTLVALREVRLERRPGYGRTATEIIWVGEPPPEPGVQLGLGLEVPDL